MPSIFSETSSLPSRQATGRLGRHHRRQWMKETLIEGRSVTGGWPSRMRLQTPAPNHPTAGRPITPRQNPGARRPDFRTCAGAETDSPTGRRTWRAAPFQLASTASWVLSALCIQTIMKFFWPTPGSELRQHRATVPLPACNERKQSSAPASRAVSDKAGPVASQRPAAGFCGLPVFFAPAPGCSR